MDLVCGLSLIIGGIRIIDQCLIDRMYQWLELSTVHNNENIYRFPTVEARGSQVSTID